MKSSRGGSHKELSIPAVQDKENRSQAAIPAGSHFPDVRHQMSRRIFSALGRMSFLLEANDGIIDDFFRLVDELEIGFAGMASYQEPDQGLNRLVETDEGRVVEARLILQRRLREIEVLPKHLRSESAITILLTLFVEDSGGEGISSKSICIASGKPLTTALRLLDRLEQEDLIVRGTSASDQRITTIKLTEAGRELARKITDA